MEILEFYYRFKSNTIGEIQCDDVCIIHLPFLSSLTPRIVAQFELCF